PSATNNSHSSMPTCRGLPTTRECKSNSPSLTGLSCNIASGNWPVVPIVVSHNGDISVGPTATLDAEGLCPAVQFHSKSAGSVPCGGLSNSRNSSRNASYCASCPELENVTRPSVFLSSSSAP